MPERGTDPAADDAGALRRVVGQARASPSFLVFMAMSGVLAAVALLADSVPILIGSMVIAPALSPLGLAAFALADGRVRLALRGLGTAAVGLGLATLCALGTTWLLNATGVIPPETNLLDKPLLEERVHPGWYSVTAALAAGVAGTVALAKDKTDALVGAVAALALVPAAAAAAIALLSHDPVRALGGMALLGINVVLIVAAGVATLLVMRLGGKRRG